MMKAILNHSNEKLLAVIMCALIILLNAQFTAWLTGPEYPMLIASMGASVVIILLLPGSPFAQPWPFAGGQIFSAIIGISCAQYINDIALASACAVGFSVFCMVSLRCLHPPGAATALAPVLAGDALRSLHYDLLIYPVAINVGFMLVIALLVNRYVLQRDYPNALISKQKSQHLNLPVEIGIKNVNEDDLRNALNNSKTLIDASVAEIKQILWQAEKHSFQRRHAATYCHEIMTPADETAEYGTDVEAAWQTMYKKNIHAMPVIDQRQRVIGIVSRNDFLRRANLNVYENLQHKFRNFIQHSPFMHTDKPEYIGHLMNKSVKTANADDAIIDLIPLMTEFGIKQVPVVDQQKKLVGMINQQQLIAALSSQELG